MEHITVTPMANGYVRLTPDTGYELLNTVTGKVYSEAVVAEEDMNKYEAVPNE